MKCLQFGMVSKCAKLCVTSLRLCTLEMQEVMMRLLPSVLLQLSKISATVSMAIPVLAFLSSKLSIFLIYSKWAVTRESLFQAGMRTIKVCLLESNLAKLATSQISIFSVAEQAGLGMTWSEIPDDRFSCTPDI